ncbi:Proteasome lid subunit RPN8/RPN11, contains Jab1/MPN metalloenzyme (JAMM) motif [Halogranum gelatinilyticum]|uniref:Proteasome lid subunit RPN8/RPN11, contains Jab1/MPN metalloenzyme (JAMM) motif n=1 Tax=Halogranum gelatinilyticum TaxID=660521 RepID=A0A1G9TNH0_9EURY|nr:desampylase [Halogranum gelatinilyticum]SDM49369.1 Proteasome lid subunit RPN8/RPN11, contains Jab1/MPN metalloenzyme (JAMM) motif [Halogranum gelatinilyticum]
MTSSKLVLSPAVRSALFSHARSGVADGPREVCGVLAGNRGDDIEHVTEHHRIANVAENPRTAYELGPAETLATIEDVEARGLDVVGFYHSHPESPAQPSATDRAQATWVGYVYCIVSPSQDTIRAWHWTGEEFEPLDVVDGK